MIKSTTKILLFIVLAGILTACANTPKNTAVRNTAIYQTQEAIMQETIAAMPPTATIVPPTITEPAPVTTITPIILPTRLRYNVSATPAVIAGTGSSGLVNKGAVDHYSPATNSAVNPKQTFILTVVLKNTGTTIWNETYKVVHAGGTKMAFLDSYPIKAQVAQNGTYTLSMYMTAPEIFGNYTQNWNLVDMNNAIVTSFSYNLIVGQNSSITSVPTLTATITSTGKPSHQSQLDYMCSDSGRSIQQGQGCEEYCTIVNPFRTQCYVLGTLNPTRTMTPLPPTATSTVPPTEIPTDTPPAPTATEILTATIEIDPTLEATSTSEQPQP